MCRKIDILLQSKTVQTRSEVSAEGAADIVHMDIEVPPGVLCWERVWTNVAKSFKNSLLGLGGRYTVAMIMGIGPDSCETIASNE